MSISINKEQEAADLIESTVGNEIRNSGEVTVRQLKQMITWTYRNNVRRKRYLEQIERIDERALKYITKMVFKMSEELDLYKVKLLCCLEGIGPVMASVMLRFYDPRRYCVFGFRVWRQLLQDEKNNNRPENYVRLLKEIRKKTIETEENVRNIEVTLCKVDEESSKHARGQLTLL